MNIRKSSFRLLSVIALMAFALPTVIAENKKAKEETVELSGISIIGNQELPKTLFIVPWKNSEAGFETNLTNTLDEGMKPLDQEVFMRELDYYDFSHERGQ